MLYQVLYNRSNLHCILVLNKIDNSTKNKEVHKTSFHSRCHAVTSNGLGYKSQVAGIVSSFLYFRRLQISKLNEISCFLLQKGFSI